MKERTKSIQKLKLEIEVLEISILKAKKDLKVAYADRLTLIKEKKQKKLNNWIKSN